MIAYLLKTTKPGSKLIIYDTKPKFSKQPLFQEGWQEHYPGIIEWVPPEMTDGGIKRVDPATMTVYTGGGEATKVQVANIIPAQKAGVIAEKAGCTSGGWCPINPDDFSSTLVKDVYVLGDASIAKAMPKSGFSANSQAKVVANAVQAALAGKKKFPARYRNTCWSLIAPDDDVKVGASYTPGKDVLDAKDKFVSKTGEDAKVRNQNYQESLAWYAAITKDMFAT
jgi:sulfide dehydrogenase [flavocytochrome c] flavoprotein subunit